MFKASIHFLLGLSLVSCKSNSELNETLGTSGGKTSTSSQFGDFAADVCSFLKTQNSKISSEIKLSQNSFRGSFCREIESSPNKSVLTSKLGPQYQRACIKRDSSWDTDLLALKETAELVFDASNSNSYNQPQRSAFLQLGNSVTQHLSSSVSGSNVSFQKSLQNILNLEQLTCRQELPSNRDEFLNKVCLPLHDGAGYTNTFNDQENKRFASLADSCDELAPVK
ncbi:MAG: hypothetical protein WCI18_16915 [Pseudomonadota bacterium]